jgi:ABC-2 type transport system permease protein
MRSGRTSGSETLAGTGSLVPFTLRRERRALPWWVLGTGLLLLVQSTQSQDIYSTPAELARLRETLGDNTAVIAMSGPPELLATIGGEIVFEIFTYLAVVVALMNMFVVGRNTRSDEETGRAELVRSARVGRRAPLAATLAVAALADLVVGLVVFGVGVLTELPVTGSVLLGLATAGVGLTFAALTAVAAQVFENTRAVYGAVALAIGASYVLRAAGDVGNEALSWASPIGWGHRTVPYAGDRFWPLLLPLTASALLAALAVVLLERRDFGAGFVPTRLGRPEASRLLVSPVGLAWRLQRAALIGWACGLFLLGVAYGSVTNSIEEYVADNPEVAELLPGGAEDVVDSYLALTMLILAVISSAFGVTSALRLRGEETGGRAEPVLATAVSRLSWLGSHLSVALVGSAVVLVAAGVGEGLAYGLSVSDLGQVARMAAVGLAYVPAVWLVVAVAAFGFGWLPRAASVVAWSMVGYCAVVAVFADSFNLPDWALQASPFAHLPQVPLESFTATAAVLVVAVGAALVVGGAAGLHRRDIGY